MKTYPFMCGCGLIAWCGLLTLAPLVRADALAEQLHQLQSYQFGQRDREAMNAVEAAVNAARANPPQRAAVARQLATFLSTDATYAAKQFVCRQLVLIADQDEVPLLEKLLADGHLSHMALYAMMPIRGPAASQALRDALQHTSGRNQIGVITALGERHDPEAVGPLSLLLVGDDTEAAQAAAAALARIGNAPAAKALRAAWYRAGQPRKTAFARACLACADQLRVAGERRVAFANSTPRRDTNTAETLPAAGNRRQAEALYAILAKRASDPVVRAGALRGLALLRGPKGWPLALASLARGDRPTQRVAAALIRELPGAPPTSLLEREADRIRPRGQIYLLSVLGERRLKSALPVAEKLAHSAVLEVRLAALRALGLLGDASCVSLLAHHAAQGTPDERDAARASLRQLSSPGVNQAMIRTLETASDSERVELIQALGDRGAGKALKSILALARNPDPDTRLAAWEVLRQLSGPSDLPELVDLFLALNANDRPAAAQTVAAVARQAATDTQRTRVLSTRFAKANRLEDRLSLLKVLGLIGGPTALAVVRQARTEGPDQIQLAALRILADWPTDAAIQDLLAAARQGSDERVRAVALRGFVRQIGLDALRPPRETVSLYREAIKLATNRAEKAAILSGLAAVRTSGALELAASELNDPAARQEATVAVAELGRALCGAYPGEVRKQMQQIIELSPAEAIAAQARAVLRQIGRFGDYLSAWEVSPAYTHAGAGATRLFDLAFPPEQAGGSGVPWQVMPAGTDPQQPWLLDLKSALGGNDRVAYLRTRLYSDTPQTLWLEVGSDDGVKAWLNGSVVLADNATRSITPDQDKVKIHLQPGWNPLLLKITQNNMGWGACARLRNLDGSPARGVRAALR